MGFLSRFIGKGVKPEEESNLLSSDQEIVGRLTALIYFNLCHDPGGLAQLLKPTCAVVLHKDGSVALHCPSGPAFVHEMMSFAFLHELPAFKDAAYTLSAFSKLDESGALVKDWITHKGPTAVDAIVAEILCELKSRAKQGLAGPEKS